MASSSIEASRDGSRRDPSDSATEVSVRVRPGAPSGPPTLSVVIPCYRQARFLGEAIGSVLDQSDEDVEVVVVDDGSPDETAAVAGRFEGVRLVRQTNSGLAAARNAGFRVSRGSYLLFLDADDRLCPGAVQSGIDFARANPECGFVWGQYRMIAEDGRRIGDPPPGCPSADTYAELLRRNCVGMNATVIFRRDALDAVGGFDPSLPACEDYDVYLKIARRFPARCHDRVVAEYRWHDRNMSREAGRMLRASLRVLARQRRYLRGRSDRSAYGEGRVRWCALFGPRLAKQALERLTVRGERRRALSDLLLLLRNDGRPTLRAIAKSVTRRGAR